MIFALTVLAYVVTLPAGLFGICATVELLTR